MYFFGIHFDVENWALIKCEKQENIIEIVRDIVFLKAKDSAFHGKVGCHRILIASCGMILVAIGVLLLVTLRI